MKKSLLFLFMVISLIDTKEMAAQDCGLTVPTFLSCPVDDTVTACTIGGANVNYNVPVSSCGTPELISGPAPGGFFPIGTTEVKYQVLYLTLSGFQFINNYVYCTFTITVNPPGIWVKDLDNDGYYQGAPVQNCISPGLGYKIKTTQVPGDCNDNIIGIHPGATEIPDDGIDQDCDLFDLKTWYQDIDNDGYGNGAIHTTANFKPAGYVSDHTDCHDANASMHPGAIEIADDDIDQDCDLFDLKTWYQDIDNDGYGNGSIHTTANFKPAGYVADQTDCHDINASIHPGATEIPDDGIDQDCDLFDLKTWYRDVDNDGYGNGSIHTTANFKPAGFVADHTDCHDINASIHPGATEIPDDGIDQDCDLYDLKTWYRDMDNDGYGNGAVQILANLQPAGYVSNNTDCNDTNATIHPGATEIPGDGIDQDCDSHDSNIWYRDIDNDGYGNVAVQTTASIKPAGYVSNHTDCNDNNAAINPAAAEVCDGLDNDCDCDGSIDEGVKQVFYMDFDGDGYGFASVSVQACSAPAGFVANKTDCNDNDAAVNNPATVWIKDIDQDGYYYMSATQCSSPGPGYIKRTTQLPEDCNDNDPAINPGAVEVCNNGKDDNCNGVQNEVGCYTCQNSTFLSTTNITSNSATLNWQSIPHPAMWKIQYKINAGGSQWVDIIVAGHIRSYTLTGLLSNQGYKWQTRAMCGSNYTNSSGENSFTTAGGNARIAQANTGAEKEVTEVVIESLQINAIPNPSSKSFRISINSNNLKEPVKLIITDMLGRVIETRTTNAGQIIIGEKYRSGTYLVRIIQGKETRQLKLIKLPD